MIIQAILIVFIILVLIWFLANRTTTSLRAWKRIAILGFLGFAMVSVVDPQLTSRIANFLGVGRGADLLLYFLALAFFMYVLNQYLHNQDEQKKITKLARKVAIVEANEKLLKNG